MGSVKDLAVLEKQTEEKVGRGRFYFSDRYSVFDWGEMPDHIKNKGAALCLMGAACFERVERKGIKTHYRGLVVDGVARRLDEIDAPANIMEVSLVNVVRPKPYVDEGLKYDYGVYSPEMRNFLIPLEIIYRNGLPEGASIFKRLKSGAITYQDLGLDHQPVPGERLEKPIFDVSTKLEDKDRYITWNEAKNLVKMSDDELLRIKEILLLVDGAINEMAASASLTNEDGKIELAFDANREPMLVDVAGTLDECRFTMNGVHVSKEVARIWYRKTQWFNDVTKAKEEAEKKGIEDWKGMCVSKPELLDHKLKGIIEDMYTATANSFVGRKIFDAPSLPDVVSRYKEWLGE